MVEQIPLWAAIGSGGALILTKVIDRYFKRADRSGENAENEQKEFRQERRDELQYLREQRRRLEQELDDYKNRHLDDRQKILEQEAIIADMKRHLDDLSRPSTNSSRIADATLEIEVLPPLPPT